MQCSKRDFIGLWLSDIRFLDNYTEKFDVSGKIFDIELNKDFDLIVAIGNNHRKFEVI